jgi:hypothetical protein
MSIDTGLPVLEQLLEFFVVLAGELLELVGRKEDTPRLCILEHVLLERSHDDHRFCKRATRKVVRVVPLSVVYAIASAIKSSPRGD